MTTNKSHKEYVLETRRHFSETIRKIFGDNPLSVLVTDRQEVNNTLIQLSDGIYSDKKKMSYIWWWRGNSNNHIDRFELEDDYLYMNWYKLKIKELYINISPIPIFDFIIFRVQGEDNDAPVIENYEWNNSIVEVDLDKHNIFDYSVKGYIDDKDLQYYKQPFNFILTAQFGLPNLDIYTDDAVGLMLNKLLFEKINYNFFREWYIKVLDQLKREVDSFYIHLSKYPMLALDNKLGKLIYDDLRMFGSYELIDQTFYRARQLEELKPYDEDNMWHPPADRVAVYEGRYNHFGQSFLYLAEDESTAFSEVIPKWHRSCSMIQIKVNKPLNVLDLRKVNFYSEDKGIKYIMLHYMLVHEGTISQETKNPYIKPEYVVPRFVADCARLHNFDGILFNSTKGQGDNLVLFNPNQLKSTGKIITIDEPYIYTV